MDPNQPTGRKCGKCGAPAKYVAGDKDGLEWFECGNHDMLDNLAGVVRVSLTPIVDWFKDNGIQFEQLQ